MRSQGELYFEGLSGGQRAELLNLSRGGLCARGALPRNTPDDEERPLPLHVALGLLDGTPPIWASASVAWVEDGAEADSVPRFGLRFIDLSVESLARLEAAIAARVDAVPIVQEPGSPMRLRLASGPVLRAELESTDQDGAFVAAELPWLRVGADVEVERGGGWVPARTSWVGLDIAESGVARLRVRVAYRDERAPEEQTIPGAGRIEAEPARRATPERVDTLVGMGLSEVAAPAEAPRGDESRAHELVRLGEARRRRMAILRSIFAMLTLSAIYLGARSLRGPASATADVPVEVRPTPVTLVPTAIVSERAPAMEEPAPLQHTPVRKNASRKTPRAAR